MSEKEVDKGEAEEIEKPVDWPKNNREVNVDLAYELTNKYSSEPTIENKEILYSHILKSSLNEINSTGMHRVSDYEVQILNTLYLNALFVPPLKQYIYMIIATTTQYNNIAYKTFSDNDNITIERVIESYKGLFPELLIFHVVYSEFNYLKSQCFVDELICVMEQFIKNAGDEILYYIQIFNRLLLDLSTLSSPSVFPYLAWTRTDVRKILNFQAKTIKQTDENPSTRPLKGVLCLTISNLILKSRNVNRCNTTLYKLIDNDAVKGTFETDEIWFRKVDKLNDPREGKLLSEIISTDFIEEFDWLTDLKLDYSRESYVTSFSKSKPTSEMKVKYGKNLFGYKSDRIQHMISPPIRKGNYYFSELVMVYDIIYDMKIAKEEMKFLCSTIESYIEDNKDRNQFLQDIIKYWHLSFKDKEWESEEERRFEIFVHYENMKYKNFRIDGDFLKIKSTLFQYPDFISSDNIGYDKIKKNLQEKLSTISQKSCYICETCLNTDFDYIVKSSYCSQCKSTNIKLLDRKQPTTN